MVDGTGNSLNVSKRTGVIIMKLEGVNTTPQTQNLNTEFRIHETYERFWTKDVVSQQGQQSTVQLRERQDP